MLAEYQVRNFEIALEIIHLICTNNMFPIFLKNKDILKGRVSGLYMTMRSHLYWRTNPSISWESLQ